MFKFLLPLTFLLLLTACSGSDDKLLAKLNQQILPMRTMTSGYRILNLDSLTDFEWDSVYWFNADSGFDTNRMISGTIGFKWEGEAIPNLFTRLLFVRQKEVVDYVDCSYEPDAFPTQMYSCSKTGRGVPRKQAKFAVFRSCNHGFIAYPLIQLDCVANANFQDWIAEGCQDLPAQLARNKFLTDSLQQAEKATQAKSK